MKNKCPKCDNLKGKSAKLCFRCEYKTRKGIPSKLKGIKIAENNCKCIQCGKLFHKCKAEIKRGQGKFCSKKCFGISKKVNRPCVDCGIQVSNTHYKRCSSCARKRELNPNWVGGISRLPYHIDFDENLKESIRKRDNYECQLCYMTEEEHIVVLGRKLAVHHIDYDKSNSAPKNLLTLCNQCNSRVNFNREYWYEKFQEVYDRWSVSKLCERPKDVSCTSAG